MLTDGGRERIKLKAAYLNGLAISIFTVAALAPTASYFLSLRDVSESNTLVAAIIAGGVFMTMALHLYAQSVLDGLDQ